MTNILMLGFSVTEMVTSYIPRMKALIEKRGIPIELDHCGIGGITTEALPYFVDKIIAARPAAERVVFEVATSYVRDVYRQHLAYDPSYQKRIWHHIATLITKTRSLGKEVAFVNLPRKDVDYEVDFFEAIVAQVCASYRVPLLSISGELMIAGVDLDSVLYDEVHPSPEGSELYAERILEFLQSPGYSQLSSADESTCFESTALWAAKPGAKMVDFSRHGFRERYVELSGGEELTIRLDQPSLIEGVAILAGPRSGWLTLITDRPYTFLFYDQHCYYERMMTAVSPMGTSDTVTLRLSADVPDIPLLKGEKNFEERRVGLFYLFHAPIIL